MKILPYNTPSALHRRVNAMHDLFWAPTRGHNPAPLEQTFANGKIKHYIVKTFVRPIDKVWGMSEVFAGKHHNAFLTKNTCYDGEYRVYRALPNYGYTDTYYNKDGIRVAKKLSKGEDSVYSKNRDESYYLYNNHGVKPRECSLDEFNREIVKHQNV